MLLLGYDGTLVPFQTIPILAKPTSQVMRLLEELCAAGNLVTVASGRDKETMRSWFRSIPGIGLVAEFGLFYRYAATAGLDRSMRDLRGLTSSSSSDQASQQGRVAASAGPLGRPPGLEARSGAAPEAVRREDPGRDDRGDRR
jgi:trehalose-6-phosphatase